MSLPSSRIKNALPALIGPAVLTWLALSLVGFCSVFDADIFERLIAVFSLKTSNAGTLFDDSLVRVLRILSVFLFAAAATYCGFRLPAVPRTLVLIQLFVLSILGIVGLWQFLRVSSQPLAYFFVVFAGCAFGYGLRLIEKQRERQAAQYYELLLRNRELIETKLLLVKQDEIERRMLAADLHDQVLNDLKAVKNKLASFLEQPDKAVADSIQGTLNQAMVEIREVMDSLCPSALEHLGLVAALEDCLRRGAERGGFKVRFKSQVTNADLQCLSMVEQSLLYRLVQESVTNICKHAGASLVRGVLEQDGDFLVVKVTDNGCGIDPTKLRDDSRGVRYMRQRADLIGATIAWRAGEDGKGTCVEIRISLAGKES